MPIGCEVIPNCEKCLADIIEVGVWSYQFTQICLLPVTKAVLASNRPDYRTIQELDHKIRAFNVPVSLHSSDRSSEMRDFVQEHYSPLSASLQYLYLILMLKCSMRPSALMFLHRNYFAKVLKENPTNPWESIHGPSFITAYNSACKVLNSTERSYKKQPLLMPRVWRIWTYAFSAAVGNVALPRIKV